MNPGDKIRISSKLPCEGSITMDVDMYRAYPNPTTNWVDVQIFDTEVKEIVARVFNSLQQKVSEKKYLLKNGKIRIELNDKPAGIYFIRLDLETPVNFKIVKQ